MTETMPRAGEVIRLAPGLRRVLAPNPSPMTYWGTNTFILGEGDVAMIDPGPALPAHHDALLAALAPGERITRILVTHSHLDHSPLARGLSETTGAPVFAFGDSYAGISEVMADLVARGLSGGGEGVDRAFRPDERLGDGDTLQVGGVTLTALWTPGHMANHLAFDWNEAVFTGDLVMGWASSLVSPPDGDLTAFMASCRRLADHPARIHYPAHGAAITEPRARLEELIAHRLTREAAILDLLARQPAGVTDLTRTIYTDTPAALIPAAERNVFAHLIDLHERNMVRAAPELSVTARFERL